ncbi:MAG: extracellular solute-binding protein [Anaerolineales bacterium]|nr:extracellular solute-binding protein [Anaerolineales bacterium]
MKKLLALLSILLLAALLLVACGGEADTPTDEPAADQPAVDEPAAAPSGEKVQIRWFVGLGTGTDPAQVVEQQAVVDAFNASQDRIEVVLEVVPYDSARDTLSTQIAAGNGPDIIGPVGIGGSNDFYGQWLDIAPLIEATGYDTSIFNEALVEFYQTEEGQVGLPWMVFPTGLYFNPALFDEAGLNYPPFNLGDPYVWPDGTEEPWDWNTLAKVAKMLTVDVNGLTPLDDGFDRNNIVQTGYHPQWSGMWVVGTFWEPGLVYAGEPGAYTAALPEAWYDGVKWAFDGMWGDEPFIATGPLSGSPEFGSGNVMDSGRVAMAQTQLWFTCCVNNVSWDVAAFPANPKTGELSGRMDADTVRIWKGTPHPEEAFEFMTWLIGPGGTEPLIMGIGSVEPGYAAYGGFPAMTEYQDLYWDTKAEQFPAVTNWQVFDQALSYPDNPSAEAWKPNGVESNNRMETFWSLIQNDGTVDFDAEWDKLEADLEVIFNK